MGGSNGVGSINTSIDPASLGTQYAAPEVIDSSAATIQQAGVDQSGQDVQALLKRYSELTADVEKEKKKPHGFFGKLFGHGEVNFGAMWNDLKSSVGLDKIHFRSTADGGTKIDLGSAVDSKNKELSDVKKQLEELGVKFQNPSAGWNINDLKGKTPDELKGIFLSKVAGANGKLDTQDKLDLAHRFLMDLHNAGVSDEIADPVMKEMQRLAPKALEQWSGQAAQPNDDYSDASNSQVDLKGGPSEDPLDPAVVKQMSQDAENYANSPDGKQSLKDQLKAELVSSKA